MPERDMGEQVDAGHTTRSSKVRTDIPDSAGALPGPPGARRAALPEVWSYINPFMLYGRHLGYKGNFEKQLLQREEKALELLPCDRSA